MTDAITRMRFTVTMNQAGLMEVGCEVPQEWDPDPLKWSAEQHFLNFIGAATLAYLKNLGETLPEYADAMRLANTLYGEKKDAN